jgi:hypothetical protein
MNEEYLDDLEMTEGDEPSKEPKHKQLIKMLTFRVVPAYYREIEKVAKVKNVGVSKLIRTYIKEGMIRDGELTKKEINKFKI